MLVKRLLGVLVSLSLAMTVVVGIGGGVLPAAADPVVPGSSAAGGVYGFCTVSWDDRGGYYESVWVRCNVGAGVDEPSKVRIAYWFQGGWHDDFSSDHASTLALEIGGGGLEWVTGSAGLGSLDPFVGGTAAVEVFVGGVWRPASVEAITLTDPLSRPAVPQGFFDGLAPSSVSVAPTPGSAAAGGAYAFCTVSWDDLGGYHESVWTRCNTGGGAAVPSKVRIAYWYQGQWWWDVSSDHASTVALDVGDGGLEWVTGSIGFGSSNPFVGAGGSTHVEVLVDGVWRPARVESVTLTGQLSRPSVPQGFFDGFVPVSGSGELVPGSAAAGGVYGFCRVVWDRLSGNNSSVWMRCNTGGGVDRPTNVRVGYRYQGQWWWDFTSDHSSTTTFSSVDGSLEWATGAVDFGSTDPFYGSTAGVQVLVGGVWRPVTVQAFTLVDPLVRPVEAVAYFAGFPPGPDVTAPDVPGNVNVATVGSEVWVSWDPGVDDRGVVAYEVVRDGSLAATVSSGTVFVDASASAGQGYSYQVRALDAAQNSSVLSAAVSATVGTMPASGECWVIRGTSNVVRYDAVWLEADPADTYVVVQRSSSTASWSEVARVSGDRRSYPADFATVQPSTIEVGVVAVVDGVRSTTSTCTTVSSGSQIPPPSDFLSPGVITMPPSPQPLPPSSTAGALPPGTVDYLNNPCTSLQSGVPILDPGTTVAADYGYQRDTLIGYLWVPTGYAPSATGSITPISAVLTPNTLGILEFQPWGVELGSQHKDSLHGVGFEGSGGGSFSSFWTGNTAVSAPGGQFVMTGIEQRWGFAAITTGNYTLTVGDPVQIDPQAPPPAAPPSCVIFENLDLANDLGVQFGMIFTDEFLDLVGDISDLAVDLGGIAVQFLPGYDCVDALINGINGWNAAGCLLDLGAAGIAADLLRQAGNLSIVGRTGDDVIGAIDNIDADAFVDDLLEAVNGTCSFSAGTPVLMADGSRMPIADVQVGDYVWATDPETGETGAREVIATLPHTDQLLTLNLSSGDIVTTEDHRYWNDSDHEWQESQDLGLGDRLLSADGGIVTVEGLDWATVHTAAAYDLTIDDLHTFYIGAGNDDVLVHNSCGSSLPPIVSGNSQPPPRFITTGAGVTVDRQSVSTAIHAGNQDRHVSAIPRAVDDRRGGYFTSVDDAQTVLDHFHDGSAEIIGITRSSPPSIAVRDSSVTGFNHNIGPGNPEYLNQPTNIFIIKGTTNVSVVPGSPAWSPS